MLRLFRSELLRALRDWGVLTFVLLVPLAYPIVYSFIYTREVAREVPVVAVDQCHTPQSRELLRHLDATPQLRLAGRADNMAQARSMLERREAYGIVCVPADFADCLRRGEQARLSAFADMSGMLYYSAVLTAASNVSLAMNADIKVERTPGATREQERVVQAPVGYYDVALFNEHAGFAAYLIPAVLVLILQQTMLLAVGMSTGTDYELGRLRRLRPLLRRGRRSRGRAHAGGVALYVVAKALAYVSIYLPVSVYVLGVVPRLFGFPQVGSPLTLALLLCPMLLAFTLLAQVLTLLATRREVVMIYVVFSSLLLLFLSGVSWPATAIPPLLRGVSWCFPSTFAMTAFVKVNTMGATLREVGTEWLALWAQCAVFFPLAIAVARRNIQRCGKPAAPTR